MRFLWFCFLLLFFIPAKSQELTDSAMLIKINNSLNFYDFEEIRNYILTNGDRKTYCPTYTDNPHYEMKNLNIYLNPSQEGADFKPKALDYNIMYIVAAGDETPFNFYLYLTATRDVYLYDYKQYLADESVRKQVLAELDSILLAIKKEMKL